MNKRLFLAVALSILLVLNMFIFTSSYPRTRGDPLPPPNPRAVEIYGGAENGGYGPFPNPFPFPFGGQGLNSPMDQVIPGSRVVLYANVSYDTWPVQNTEVSFEVEDPSGSKFVLYAITDANGVANVTFRMPLPCVDLGLGQIWNATATAFIAGENTIDFTYFVYDFLVRWWSMTTNKSIYRTGENVVVSVIYGTSSWESYPALFWCEIWTELGVPINSTFATTSIGGSEILPPDVLFYSTLDLVVSIPASSDLGRAYITMECFDKHPALGGFMWCSPYEPSLEIWIEKDPWEMVYQAQSGCPIIDTATFNGGFYAVSNNTLYTYDGLSWNASSQQLFMNSVDHYENRLYVGAKGGIYSFDGASFSLIFAVQTYVRVLGVYNNTIYAGTFLDGTPILYYCNGSAENPSSWHVDTGFSEILNPTRPFGNIDSFAEYKGHLYLASGGTVYIYNGTSWSVADIAYEYAEAYLDMAVYNGKLYLATKDKPTRYPLYLGDSGFSGTIVEYDGTTWTTVLGHDYWIYSLEVYNDKLYAGTSNRIFTFNGTVWDVSFFAPRDAYYATSMTTFNESLYVGMGNGCILVNQAL